MSTQTGSAFDPTGVAGFDAFLQVAQICCDDPSQIEVVYFRQHFEHVQQFRRHLEAGFQQSDPIRPKTALYNRHRPALRQAFENFRNGMRNVEKFLEGEDAAYLEEGCYEAARALVTLRDLSDELMREEAGFPKPADAIEELAALVEFIDRGEIDLWALSKRAEDYRARCKRFREDTAIWTKSKDFPDDLMGPTLRACEELQDIERTLDSLARHSRGEQLFHLPDLKEALVSSGDNLKACHAEIMKILLPPKTCPQCGHVNGSAEKFCTACNAKLPDLLSHNTSTFSSQEQAAPAEDVQPRFAYLAKVEDAVEAYLAGESDLGALQSIIDWFCQRVKQGQDRYRQLTPPPAQADSQRQREADEVKANFERGTESLQGCARELQRFLNTLDREALSQALEHLREGERLIGAAQVAVSKR